MTARNKLSAAFVKSAPVGKHCDGGGLWLVKRADGGAQWVLRVTIYGNRKEMGLGSLSNVSLKQARELAEKWRQVVAEGSDPIKVRASEQKAAKRADISLRAVALETFEARKAELKNDGKAGRWFSPLELHVLPKLGKTPVTEIDAKDIRDTLKPIWHEKGETARKAINRTGIVLKHAAAMGLDVDLQATDKAKLLLGKSRQKPQNIPAMNWRDVPQFYASLEEPTITHLALRLLILTGVRSFPLRHLELAEIEGNTWTIPAEKMKGLQGRTRSFRVPLSDEALHVIQCASPFSREGYLFPNVRKGVISDATMGKLMERRGLIERPHGFRSSLRTWLSETTDTPHEVAEMMLAHETGSAVVKAYRRTDHLEQRRVLAQRWAAHVLGQTGKLLSITSSKS